MEGRHHTGVTIGLLSPQDPTQEAAWNRWYNEIHLPDMLGLGQFPIGARYQRVGDYKTPGDARYLVLTETIKADPQAAYDAQLAAYRALPASRRENRPATQIGHIGVYKMATAVGNGRGRKAKGILNALSNCKDKAKEKELSTWYDEHHMPEILSSRAYYAGTRYTATKLTASGTQFLAIYETEMDDPVAAYQEVGKIRSRRRHARSSWTCRTSRHSSASGCRRRACRPKAASSPLCTTG